MARLGSRERAVLCVLTSKSYRAQTNLGADKRRTVQSRSTRTFGHRLKNHWRSDMKTTHVMKVVAVAVLLSVSSIGVGVNWSNKKVGLLQGTYDGADCFYFTLEGVAEADPAKP